MKLAKILSSPDVKELAIRNPENVRFWNAESRAWIPESIGWNPECTDLDGIQDLFWRIQ